MKCAHYIPRCIDNLSCLCPSLFIHVTINPCSCVYLCHCLYTSPLTLVNINTVNIGILTLSTHFFVLLLCSFMLLLLLLFGTRGAWAHMGIPRAQERNKTLVARFWTPGVGILWYWPLRNLWFPRHSRIKKWVKTPPKNEKTTITAQQPCIYQGNIYIRSSELTLILPYMTVKFKVTKLPWHAWAMVSMVHAL